MSCAGAAVAGTEIYMYSNKHAHAHHMSLHTYVTFIHTLAHTHMHTRLYRITWHWWQMTTNNAMPDVEPSTTKWELMRSGFSTSHEECTFHVQLFDPRALLKEQHYRFAGVNAIRRSAVAASGNPGIKTCPTTSKFKINALVLLLCSRCWNWLKTWLCTCMPHVS